MAEAAATRRGHCPRGRTQGPARNVRVTMTGLSTYDCVPPASAGPRPQVYGFASMSACAMQFIFPDPTLLFPGWVGVDLIGIVDIPLVL